MTSTRLRLPDDLHKQLTEIAKATGISLNTLIIIALRGMIEGRFQ
jgi:predicted HicB family RNase H-like nuclease